MNNTQYQISYIFYILQNKITPSHAMFIFMRTICCCEYVDHFSFSESHSIFDIKLKHSNIKVDFLVFACFYYECFLFWVQKKSHFQHRIKWRMKERQHTHFCADQRRLQDRKWFTDQRARGWKDELFLRVFGRRRDVVVKSRDVKL